MAEASDERWLEMENDHEHRTSERELTEAELNHVSGGTPPKQEAVFPTETIKFTYGAIEWTPKGWWRKIMSKNTLRNVKASVEVHEVKDELSEAELNAVSGGKQKPDGTAGGNVAAKWSVAQGAVAWLTEKDHEQDQRHFETR
jgi:hypothetical protein